MKRYSSITALLFLLLAVLPAQAKNDSLVFITNKGQWADSIRYAVMLPGGQMNLTTNGFDYYWLSQEDMKRCVELIETGRQADSQVVHGHNYQIRFLGANKTVNDTGLEKRSRYINYYYGKDSSQWKSHIPLYGKVMQHNIYNGIDLAVYSKGQSLKYDFIVAAGAQPSSIQLAYNGVQPEILPTGQLKISSTVSEVIQQAPYAYQIINGQEIAVACHFTIDSNQVSFSFPNGYDSSQTLIIDPELIFATYSGAGDFFSGYFSFCSTYDQNGCLYAAGNPVRGLGWLQAPQWPTTPGAFQTQWTTIYEPMVCINKYNASGSNLLFSTYYGGGGPADIPHSMVVNDQNELIMAGSTGSFNLPITQGCFDSTKSGGTDIFIAHFTEDGSGLIGATYVGGNIGNSINGIDMFSTFGLSAASQNKTSPIELALDTAGNIWAVCNTSTIDFPVTANAFQPAFGGGNADGVVFGLNPTCSQMLYGSYIGGNNTDAGYGIQMNHAGNLVICGATKSSDFPTTSLAYKPTAPGNSEWDGFAAVINPVNGSLINATYLGTNEADQAVNVQIDGYDNIYILGRTLGNYPVSPNVYNMPETDLFVQKLNYNLSSSLLTTRLGNLQSDSTRFFPMSFLVDNCTNVYVTGVTQDYKVPLANMPLTPNAYQDTVGNFWFCVLKPNFSDLLYATYYGRTDDTAQGINGDHVHVGTYHMDPQGILYQSLCVNSESYPGTSPQSWSQFNQNTVGQDILSFKFAFQLAGVDAGAIGLANGQNDSSCAPYTVQFENNSTMAMDYTWDFGDGSPVSHDSIPSHTYQQAGTFTVSLHAHNDTTCIEDDTSYTTITIFNPQAPDINLITDTLICETTDSVHLSVTINNPSSHNRILWEPAIGIPGSRTGSSVTIVPGQNSLYTVTVWDTIPGYCGFRTTDTVLIDYKPRMVHILTPDTLVCQGAAVQMSAEATTGYTFHWTPTQNVVQPTALSPVIRPDSSTNYILTASYPGCADTTDTVRLNVDHPAGITYTAQPNRICIGAEAVYFYPEGNDSTMTGLYWQFGDDGDLSSRPGEEKVQHAFEKAGHFPVTLTAKFRVCPDSTYTDTIYIYPLPNVYLGGDTSLCLDGDPMALSNLSDNEPGIYHYLWNNGDTGTTLRIVHPGTYSLRVSAEPLGCNASESVRITKDCFIDIPNAFTPNNDGVDDYFLPRKILSKGVTTFHMVIYNRWGQKIFETNNPLGRGWDGNFNGEGQPQGVYIYQIQVSYKNSRQEKYTGNVTLLR